MAKQIAILGRLGDTVVDARQPAGNRANHTTAAQLPHQVFIKQVKFSWVHSRAWHSVLNRVTSPPNMPKAGRTSKAILSWVEIPFISGPIVVPLALADVALVC